MDLSSDPIMKFGFLNMYTGNREKKADISISDFKKLKSENVR